MTTVPPFKVSVIIAARVGQTQVAALDGLSQLLGDANGIEVLLVRGRSPSRQRNLAAGEAQGEILYFLDDDSLIASGAVERLRNEFSDPRVSVLGGPNLCPSDASFLHRVFAAVMGNRLVFGPSSARYRRIGRRRLSSEKELILCNMAIRASAFHRAGGFDESLYPNEENALLDEIAKTGDQIVYDPELLVSRYPRSTLSAFVRMLYRYGRGRGEQVRLYPGVSSVLNFVPAMFVVYLVGLAILSLVSSELLQPFLIPLVFYAALSVAWTLASRWRLGLPVVVASIPLVPVSHIAYGLGLWKGLIAGVAKPGEMDDKGEVTLERPSLS